MGAVNHPLVRVAAPIALGDSVEGWRIVGTTPALLSVYRADIASGRMWDKPLEAVVGAQAARALHLKIGTKFVGAPGLSPGGEMHSQFPYVVVGILSPTRPALYPLALSAIPTRPS